MAEPWNDDDWQAGSVQVLKNGRMEGWNHSKLSLSCTQGMRLALVCVVHPKNKMGCAKVNYNPPLESGGEYKSTL
jgi:hypothetical protein